MFRPTTIALLFFSLLALQVEAGEIDGAVSVEEMAYQELKSAILRGNEVGLDRSALILTLGYADSPSARRVLVEIADYYLGSAVAESVVTSVSRHGETIVDDLEEAISHESTCIASDRTRCLSKEDRFSFLRRLREIAGSGELVKYAL